MKGNNFCKDLYYSLTHFENAKNVGFINIEKREYEVGKVSEKFKENLKWFIKFATIGNWENTKEDVRIVDNGDKDPLDKLKSNKSSNKGDRAVTTKSFLVCKYGGIIEPLTSGQ